MNRNSQERMETFLKRTIEPMAAHEASLQRDLWPAMLQRIDARHGRVPWFDWALLVILAVWLIFFPGAIPVLLYHL